MGFFSRKSRSKRSGQAEESSNEQTSNKNDSKKRAQSVPVSRANSVRHSQHADTMLSHPAYAQSGFASSNHESFLPVPEVPADMQKQRRGRPTNAGQDFHRAKSAPASPKMAKSDLHTDEDDRQSRHDSANSTVELPRIDTESSIRPGMSFAEEIALDPVFQAESRRPDQRLVPAKKLPFQTHSPQVSVIDINEQASMEQSRSRGRPQRAMSLHSSVPSYSMPIRLNRNTIMLEHDTSQRQNEMMYNAPLPGAHQPLRPKSFAPEHFRQNDFVPSPALRPQILDDTASVQSMTFQPPPPLLRHASHASHQSVSVTQVSLSVLDGLKVNKRGKILDEEGDAIGELIEGDIMDCVRQRCNAIGEVLDEYGRVVGRVRALQRDLGISPAFNTSSPAIMDRRNDYFNIAPSSPMVMPANDGHDSRRVVDESHTKYRLTMDIPPVPVLPASYQDAPRSPVTRPYADMGVSCVELDATEQTAPIEAIPVFDLSEPFIPEISPKTATFEASVKDDKPEPLPVALKAEASSSAVEPKAEIKQMVPVAEKKVTPTKATEIVDEAERHRREARAQLESKQEEAPAKSEPQPIVSRFDSAVALDTLASISKAETPAPLQSNPPTSPTRPVTALKASPVEPKKPSTTPITIPQQPSRNERSPSTSDYTSDETSEGESVEVVVPPRKGVRISNLPPTTIPPRPITRTMSDGSALARISAMPSVPESEPLPESPFKSTLLSPNDATSRPFPSRAKSARTAPPLPAFPRTNSGSKLPPSPFAAAVAANSPAVGQPKRATMARPGIPPANIRAARNRYTLNAPLVSSPLSDHRKTLSTMTASTISSISSSPTPSDGDSDRGRSDAISIISAGGGRPRTYFTHAGRVTVEDGDLPPSLQKKDEVEVTERPVSRDSKKTSIKEKRKSRFSIHIGKKSQLAAAH